MYHARGSAALSLWKTVVVISFVGISISLTELKLPGKLSGYVIRGVPPEFCLMLAGLAIIAMGAGILMAARSHKGATFRTGITREKTDVLAAAYDAALQGEYDVSLESPGERKIQVLKAVRDLRALGLQDAMEIIDNAPRLVKEKIKLEEAETIKAKLEAEGAIVSVKQRM